MNWNNPEEVKKYYKEYKESNKEKKKLYDKIYREKHKEEIKLYYQQHKEEINKKRREYRKLNAEKINIRQQNYYRTKYVERSKEYRKNNKEKIKASKEKWEKENPEKSIIMRRKSSNKYNKKLKMLVLLNYGGNNPKCNCCGNTTIEFLSIDHINGGGNSHRKEIKARGNGLYKWLITNNFPDGYRILCFNCNCAIGFFGYCPHKNKERHEEYILLMKESLINLNDYRRV